MVGVKVIAQKPLFFGLGLFNSMLEVEVNIRLFQGSLVEGMFPRIGELPCEHINLLPFPSCIRRLSGVEWIAIWAPRVCGAYVP